MMVTPRLGGTQMERELRMSENREIKTWGEFVDRMMHLELTSHDYNTSAEAVVEAAVLAFNIMASSMGLTGFQGGWAALTAYCEEMSLTCPVMMLKAEDLLYPQYNVPGRVQEWIDESREWCAEQAQAKLDAAKDDSLVHPAVRKRWMDLACG